MRNLEVRYQELSDAKDRLQLKLHQVRLLSVFLLLGGLTPVYSHLRPVLTEYCFKVENEVDRLQTQLIKEQNKDFNQNISG